VRIFAPEALPKVQQLLHQLSEPTLPAQYREAMFELGYELAVSALSQFDVPTSTPVSVVCTNEDADFLGFGFLRCLEEREFRASLVCFWNDRVSLGFGQDRAPIVRSYIEPDSRSQPNQVLFILKSIISSSCVVRTNIAELVDEVKPTAIVVASPVILKGAQQRLEDEFPEEISRLFRYVWFAEDDVHKNGEVIPGVGGQVYERLGLGDSDSKNRYVPQVVKDRRKKIPVCS
jgi:hypothetical protein